MIVYRPFLLNLLILVEIYKVEALKLRIYELAQITTFNYCFNYGYIRQGVSVIIFCRRLIAFHFLLKLTEALNSIVNISISFFLRFRLILTIPLSCFQSASSQPYKLHLSLQIENSSEIIFKKSIFRANLLKLVFMLISSSQANGYIYQ